MNVIRGHNKKKKSFSILTNEVPLHNVCTMVLLARVVVCTLVFERTVLSLRIFMFMWLRWLTCICFCGCDVWVTAGSAFSRGPRAFSPPSELIIYSIYKTLYVQNRKICKGNKKHGRMSEVNQQFLNPQIMFKTHTFSSFTMLLQQRFNTFPCVSA